MVVLAVSMARTMHDEDELRIAFGTSNGYRYMAVHRIAKPIGLAKAQALCLFHSLTRCDTTSSFARHDKTSAWFVWY